MSSSQTRLVVVSNRLPIALKAEEGELRLVPGSGGLVTALAPVLKNRGGVWIGWPGLTPDGVAPQAVDRLLRQFSRDAGYTLHPVILSEEDVAGFYHGFSNEVLWPLFHDFQARCRFSPAYWQTYQKVNGVFAEAVAQESGEDDYVWVHDYHLTLVAEKLKEIGQRRRTGFFLHIPFPAADIFLKLPWRGRLIRALLEYDLIGFQTMRDRRNFTDCLRYLVPEAKLGGRGPVAVITLGDRKVRAGSFPISIDFGAFCELAASAETRDKTEELRQAFGDRRLILGVDRLDYSKGIPERLLAIRESLVRFPELKGTFTFIQVLVPSREEVREYQIMKKDIETLVGQINGQHSLPGWSPIHYQYRSLPRPELVAHYRAADAALVTPLRDGMNLVAKEFCACDIDETRVLILSEFAGAASEFQRHALLVNPFDQEGVAKAIQAALTMPRSERRRRMRRMRVAVRRYDIFWWVDAFLQTAISRKLADFPPMEGVNFQDSPPPKEPVA